MKNYQSTDIKVCSMWYIITVEIKLYNLRKVLSQIIISDHREWGYYIICKWPLRISLFLLHRINEITIIFYEPLFVLVPIYKEFLICTKCAKLHKTITINYNSKLYIFSILLSFEDLVEFSLYSFWVHC